MAPWTPGIPRFFLAKALCGEQTKPRPEPIVSERFRAKSCWDSRESTSLTSLRALVDLHLDNFAHNNLRLELKVRINGPKKKNSYKSVSRSKSVHGIIPPFITTKKMFCRRHHHDRRPGSGRKSWFPLKCLQFLITESYVTN